MLVDWQTEFALIFSFSYMILLPSVLTYIFTGIYGLALWKSPFEPIISFLVFTALKFLISFSAVLTAVFIWAYIEEWSPRINIFELILLCLMLTCYLGFALLVALIYLDARAIVVFLGKRIPRWMKICAFSIHAYLARNLMKVARVTRKADGETHDIETLKELLATLIDSVDGYEGAMKTADNSNYAAIFASVVAERQTLAAEIKAKISQSVVAVIDEAERGENHVKAKFEKAKTDKDLSANIREFVATSAALVEAGQEKIRALKRSLNV